MILALCLVLATSSVNTGVPSLVHCERPATSQTDPDPFESCPPPEAKQLAILPAPIRFSGRDDNEEDEKGGGNDRGGHQERVPPQVRWQ